MAINARDTHFHKCLCVPSVHNRLDNKDSTTTSASAEADLDFLACTTPSDYHWSEDSIWKEWMMDGVCVCVCVCVCVQVVYANALFLLQCLLICS